MNKTNISIQNHYMWMRMSEEHSEEWIKQFENKIKIKVCIKSVKRNFRCTTNI